MDYSLLAAFLQAAMELWLIASCAHNTYELDIRTSINTSVLKTANYGDGEACLVTSTSTSTARGFNSTIHRRPLEFTSPHGS